MKSILSILTFLPLAVFAQEWELKKDKENIKVYTRHVEGSGLKAIKATTTFPCNVETCVAVLKDIPHLTELFPDCERTEKITQTDKDQVHYLHLNAPWPVTDRDATFELVYNYNPATETVTINADIITGKYPVNDGLIRLTEGVGTWTFKKSGIETDLTYLFHGEPGGNIPDWLANSVVEENPFEMLQNFHKLIGKSRYHGHSYAFMNQK